MRIDNTLNLLYVIYHDKLNASNMPSWKKSYGTQQLYYVITQLMYCAYIHPVILDHKM